MKYTKSGKFLCIWVIIVGTTYVVSGCTASTANHDAWFGEDKFLHFSAAAVIGAGSGVVARNIGTSRSEASVLGVSVAIGAGAIKELYDKWINQRYWSWKDIFWDTVGGIAGSLVGARCR